MNQSELKTKKHSTGAKQGKTRKGQVAIGFGFADEWLEKHSVHSRRDFSLECLVLAAELQTLL